MEVPHGFNGFNSISSLFYLFIFLRIERIVIVFAVGLVRFFPGGESYGVGTEVTLFNFNANGIPPMA